MSSHVFVGCRSRFVSKLSHQSELTIVFLSSSSCPTRPAPGDFNPSAPPPTGSQQQPQQSEPTAIPMPRLVIMPGLEFDPSRKYRYGHHALLSAALIFIAFVLVEMRDCNGGPMVDLDRLQALHVSLMVFAFVLYLLSLFGIADFIFQYKIFFLVGALSVYVVAALMVWMSYEAVVNPCVKTLVNVPVDLSFGTNKNVFNRGDVVGIMVLLLDVFATIMMLSAAGNFYKRY